MSNDNDKAVKTLLRGLGREMEQGNRGVRACPVCRASYFYEVLETQTVGSCGNRHCEAFERVSVNRKA